MLVCQIKKGAIFYGLTKRRLEVEISDDIKEKVRNCFNQMHSYYEKGYIPKVKPSKRCNACSLKSLCMPKLYKHKNVNKYINDTIQAGSDEE